MNSVLKKSTITILRQKLTTKGMAIVTSWAMSNPKQVQEWEKDQSLLSRAEEAQEQAAEVLERARDQGIRHLADHEIYEMMGGPTLRL